MSVSQINMEALEALKKRVEQATTDYLAQRALVNSIQEDDPQKYYRFGVKEKVIYLLTCRKELWENSVALKKAYDTQMRSGANDETVFKLLQSAGSALKGLPITKKISYPITEYKAVSEDFWQGAQTDEKIEKQMAVFPDVVTFSANQDMKQEGQEFYDNIRVPAKVALIRILESYSEENILKKYTSLKRGYKSKERITQIKEISAELEFIKEHPPRDNINGKMFVNEVMLAQLTRGCLLRNKEKLGVHRNSILEGMLNKMLKDEAIKQGEIPNNQEQDKAAYIKFMQTDRLHALNRSELNNFNKLQRQVEEAQKKHEALGVLRRTANNSKKTDASRERLLKVSKELIKKIEKQPQHYSPETSKLLESVVITISKVEGPKREAFEKLVTETEEHVAKFNTLRGVLDKYEKGQLTDDYLQKKSPPEKGGFLNGMRNAFARKSLAAIEPPDEITSTQKMFKKILADYPDDKALQDALPVIRGCLLNQIKIAQSSSAKEALTSLLENPKMGAVHEGDSWAYNNYRRPLRQNKLPD